MDNSTPTAAPAAPAPYHFSLDEAVKAAESIGALVAAINPAYAGALAALEGAASFMASTVVPAFQHYQTQQYSVVTQAQLAIDSATERARVGAPAATVN